MVCFEYENGNENFLGMVVRLFLKLRLVIFWKIVLSIREKWVCLVMCLKTCIKLYLRKWKRKCKNTFNYFLFPLQKPFSPLFFFLCFVLVFKIFANQMLSTKHFRFCTSDGVHKHFQKQQKTIPIGTKINPFSIMLQAERDGSNEFNNYQPGSLNTTDQLIKDLDNIDIVFHIGDITYANGYISQWDQFTAQVEPIVSTVPYMIARFDMLVLFQCLNWEFSHFLFLNLHVEYSDSGNHERDVPGTGSFYDGNDSGGECGVLAETMFYVPAENRAKFW